MSDDTPTRQPDVVRPFSKTGEDPTAFFSDLRERCPVADVQERTRYWALTRHEDIVHAAMEPEVFSSAATPRLRLRSVPLESDPPQHMQIRRILQPFFMPARMKTLEAATRAVAVELLAPLVAAGGGDFGPGLCQPMPPRVLLALIGQPQTDWSQIKRWCEQAYLDRSSDPKDQEVFREADEGLYAYCRAIVADRRAAPRDPADDIPSALLAAQVDGEDLSDDLAVGALRLLVAAGHDSTTTAMSICLHHLARDPEAQARLRGEPDLIPAAIEEMLRLETPVLSMPRTVTRDVELQGRALRAGDRVRLVFASGNRDPRAFDRADECVLDRRPNRHMVFGHGIHTCIGAPLARIEIKVALEELLRRTTRFGVTGEIVREYWHPYGAHALPLSADSV